MQRVQGASGDASRAGVNQIGDHPCVAREVLQRGDLTREKDRSVCVSFPRKRESIGN